MSFSSADAELLADFVQSCINNGVTPVCHMQGKDLNKEQKKPIPKWFEMNEHQFHCQTCRVRWILNGRRYLKPERFPND